MRELNVMALKDPRPRPYRRPVRRRSAHMRADERPAGGEQQSRHHRCSGRRQKYPVSGFDPFGFRK